MNRKLFLYSICAIANAMESYDLTRVPTLSNLNPMLQNLNAMTSSLQENMQQLMQGTSSHNLEETKLYFDHLHELQKCKQKACQVMNTEDTSHHYLCLTNMKSENDWLEIILENTNFQLSKNILIHLDFNDANGYSTPQQKERFFSERFTFALSIFKNILEEINVFAKEKITINITPLKSGNSKYSYKPLLDILCDTNKLPNNLVIHYTSYMKPHFNLQDVEYIMHKLNALGTQVHLHLKNISFVINENVKEFKDLYSHCMDTLGKTNNRLTILSGFVYKEDASYKPHPAQREIEQFLMNDNTNLKILNLSMYSKLVAPLYAKVDPSSILVSTLCPMMRLQEGQNYFQLLFPISSDLHIFALREILKDMNKSGDMLMALCIDNLLDEKDKDYSEQCMRILNIIELFLNMELSQNTTSLYLNNILITRNHMQNILRLCANKEHMKQLHMGGKCHEEGAVDTGYSYEFRSLLQKTSIKEFTMPSKFQSNSMGIDLITSHLKLHMSEDDALSYANGAYKCMEIIGRSKAYLNNEKVFFNKREEVIKIKIINHS